MDENENRNGNINPPRNLFFNLMPSIGGGSREPPPPLPPVMAASTNGGPSHHVRVGAISESHLPFDYWVAQNRDKYLNPLYINPNHDYYPPTYSVSPESSSTLSIQIPQQISLPKNETSFIISEVKEMCGERDSGGSGGGGGGGAVMKKRGGGKVSNSAPKEKKQRIKTNQGGPHDDSTSSKAPKKRAEVVINGRNMDISEIPIPVCSCTGTAQQCYRWGSGGWQSACCTNGLSVYPLPMSTKRRGARIAGRKMSIGAFKKVLEKVCSEGYDFSSPIDLRSYWARHGTNKFVTLRGRTP